jgi:hypothetical protein
MLIDFIDLLLNASHCAPVTVVATVRADFYDPLIGHSEIRSLLPTQQVLLGSMPPSELEHTITAPAKKVGLTFDPPNLVQRILDEAGEDEGTLPLLQYALKETWALREANAMTADSYARSGGVQEAIRITAERAFEALSADEQQAARQLFLRLVTPGEGKEDTRARAAMPAELVQRKVVELFAGPRTRLLVTGWDRAARPIVEVAHEALIRRWPRLRGWIDANPGDAAVAGGNPDMLLPSGFQLERARALLANPGDISVDDIREFIAASEAAESKRQDKLIADERHRVEAEEAIKREWIEREAERQRVAERTAAARRLTRRTGLPAVGLAVLLVLAVWLAVYATRERSRAEAQRSLALAVEANAAGAAGDQPSAMLIALHALSRRPGSPEAGAALYQAWLNNREMALAGHTGPVYFAQFSPDGRRVVTASADNTARVWDLGQQRPTSITLAGHEDAVYTAEFDHDGRHVVTASLDGTARVWDLSGSSPTSIPLRGHAESVLSAKFSADGRRVVTTSTDHTARVWDLSGSQPTWIELRGHKGSVLSAAFSPDGSHVATTSTDNTARVWDLSGGYVELLGHTDAVLSIAFSNDGHLVTASRDGTARVWDLSGDQPKSVVARGHTQDVLSAAFSLDGHRFVTASMDGTARVWPETGFNSVELVGHKGMWCPPSSAPTGCALPRLHTTGRPVFGTYRMIGRFP